MLVIYFFLWVREFADYQTESYRIVMGEKSSSIHLSAERLSDEIKHMRMYKHFYNDLQVSLKFVFTKSNYLFVNVRCQVLNKLDAHP